MQLNDTADLWRIQVLNIGPPKNTKACNGNKGNSNEHWIVTPVWQSSETGWHAADSAGKGKSGPAFK